MWNWIYQTSIVKYYFNTDVYLLTLYWLFWREEMNLLNFHFVILQLQCLLTFWCWLFSWRTAHCSRRIEFIGWRLWICFIFAIYWIFTVLQIFASCRDTRHWGGRCWGFIFCFLLWGLTGVIASCKNSI